MSGSDGVNVVDNPSEIDTDSWDIQRAFFQGLTHDELQQQACSLGYKVKLPSRVYVDSLEDSWRHFRMMAWARLNMKISDNARIDWVLTCLRATHGFGDAPLIFQLALLCEFISLCHGMISVVDEDYICWIWDGRHVISLTADVDDLPITAANGV